MSDSYQAIYDAVRSRISGGNVNDAVRDVLYQQFDMSHQKAILQQEIFAVSQEMMRPSVLMRPTLMQDGNMWLAIYGDLPTGVVGSGDTPRDAMQDFDAAWLRKPRIPPARTKE